MDSGIQNAFEALHDAIIGLERTINEYGNRVEARLAILNQVKNLVETGERCALPEPEQPNPELTEWEKAEERGWCWNSCYLNFPDGVLDQYRWDPQDNVYFSPEYMHAPKLNQSDADAMRKTCPEHHKEKLEEALAVAGFPS